MKQCAKHGTLDKAGESMGELKHGWEAVAREVEAAGLVLDRGHELEWAACLTYASPIVRIRGGTASVVPVYSRRGLLARSAKDVELTIVDLIAGTPITGESVVGPDVGRSVAAMALRVVRLWRILQMREVSLTMEDAYFSRQHLVMRLEFYPKWTSVRYANAVRLPLVLLEDGHPVDQQLDAFVNGCVHDLHRMAVAEWDQHVVTPVPDHRCPTCGDPEFNCHHDEE